jgi:hypothetical protein
MLEFAEPCAGRNLSREEWQSYFPGQVYRPTFPGLPEPPRP